MGRGGQRSRMLSREQEASRIAEALSFPEALARYHEGQSHGAELTAVYIAERVHRAAGARWLQADRRDRPADPLPASTWLRLFAERELCRVPPPVPRALIGWARDERDVTLLFHVPTPRALLALQARGRRCVSLLAEGVPTAPHEDGLAFAVHDLCHLEKFVDPTFHEEQVGFFALLDRALDDPRWAALEAPFDALWQSDRDHVLADMNGSAVFLLLVLKNKLKLATRRALARERGAPIPTGGPLDDHEREAYARAETILLDLLDLQGETHQAGLLLSSRIDAATAAQPLIDRFRDEGKQALAARAQTRALPPPREAEAV